MKKQELNELLMNSVQYRNTTKAEQLLKSGANPNYCFPPEKYNGMADYQHQPYSPLRLVVFIISDCMLDDNELEKCYEIASLLIKFGADAVSALELAELRYGNKQNWVADNTPYSKVLHLVKNAADTSNPENLKT